MLDSEKLNPATVIVPLLPVDDGEPPPDDPQALPIRLSPRIEDIRARKAHLCIAFPPGRGAGPTVPAPIAYGRGARTPLQFPPYRTRTVGQDAGSARGAAA